MANIRREVGRILGFTITDEGFRKAFETLEKEGRVTMRHVIQILILLLEYEEQREQK